MVISGRVRERAIINQSNTASVSKTILGKPLRDGVQCSWAFLSAQIPSWTELVTMCTPICDIYPKTVRETHFPLEKPAASVTELKHSFQLMGFWVWQSPPPQLFHTPAGIQTKILLPPNYSDKCIQLSVVNKINDRIQSLDNLTICNFTIKKKLGNSCPLLVWNVAISLKLGNTFPMSFQNFIRLRSTFPLFI